MGISPLLQTNARYCFKKLCWWIAMQITAANQSFLSLKIDFVAQE